MSATRAGQTMVETNGETDFQNYLKRHASDNGMPAQVPPKENLLSPTSASDDADADFDPRTISRTTSAFSFSRASFSSQISSLTTIALPRAESMAASIAAISSASKAVKALSASAEQIQMWIRKAVKVLSTLDADDDVEWAAAAGREALKDTDKSVTKFETVVSVYVQAIEELQSRPDVAELLANDLEDVVLQMESTLNDWEKVRQYLKNVRDQVELAMEWEELWGVVLGDVGDELEQLNTMVFQMEENRYKAMSAEKPNESPGTVDLNELQTIVDETPSQHRAPSNFRFSLPPAFASSPLCSPVVETPHDDATLLGLFARMQPLRASLDFLPMRLSMFQSRAERIFPTACAELEDKREQLEGSWAGLAKDAESLRHELAEDRWVLVFRNAGRQARKMCESVERSLVRLQDAIESGTQYSNPAALAKKAESFEVKKTHYGPAIDRVLAIITKGLNDRFTVNGEIIRLHTDLSARARHLNGSMRAMEKQLEHMHLLRNSQPRDSLSSVMTMDRSTSESMVETPGSSPPSSVVLSRGKADANGTPTINDQKQRRSSGSRPPLSTANKRCSSLPQPRRPATPLSVASSNTISHRSATPSVGRTSIYRQGIYTPSTVSAVRPQAAPLINRPRWSSSTNTNDLPIGHNLKSSTSITPTPIRKISFAAPRSLSSYSFHPPFRSSSREASFSPAPAPSTKTRRNSRLASFAERVASPSPLRNPPLLDPLPYHRGRIPPPPSNGTIRSPSSIAVHKNNSPTMTSNTHVDPWNTTVQRRTSQRSLLSRASSDLPQQPRESDTTDRRVTASPEHINDTGNGDPRLNPIARPKLAPRTETAARGTSTRGKRMSMLPVPQARAKALGSGRESAFGDRTLCH